MALFSLSGKVVHGNHLGRSLGFPTANLHLENATSLVPRSGVYAARVRIGEKQYAGMANIGYRPTLKEQVFSVEVNIFDFSEDIYGETLSVDFICRLRDEVKFSSLDALVEQMNKDRAAAKKALSGSHHTNPDAE